ncbi:MAG: ABC transporter permease [Tissierellia bacterium]|nr:ABC transporter permease [Tissierellia bacterium]
MKFLVKLAIKYLKKGAARTILSVLGIAISISLMVGLFETLISIRDTLMHDDIYLFGYQDFEMDDVDAGKLKALRTSTYIDEVAKYKQDYSLAEFKSVAPYHHQLINVYIKDVNEDYFNDIFANDIIEGRLPENENEVIVPYTLKPILPIFDSLGGYVESTFYKTTAINDAIFEILNQEDEATISNMVSNIKFMGLDDYLLGKSKEPENLFRYDEFKIVGYYSGMVNSNSMASFDDAHSRLDFFSGTVLRFKDIEDDNYSVAGTFRDFVDIDEPITTLRSIEGLKNIADDDIRINQPIIEMKYLGMNSNYNFFIYAGLILMVLIMVAVIVFIYNIFNTNYIEKTKDLGLLKVVGLTNKQLFYLVLIEGYIYFLVSLPIGYVLGKIFSTLLYRFVTGILNDSIIGLVLNVIHTTRWWVFVLVSAITYILIVISQVMASKQVFSINTISALNNGIDDMHIKPNRKQYRLTKKIFGYEGFLAFRNIVRNKKRYILITISITLSIILLVSISFLDYIFGISSAQMKENPEYRYGIVVSTDVRETNNIIRDLEDIRGVQASHTYSQTQSVVLIDESLKKSYENIDLFVVKDEAFDKKYPEFIGEDVILVLDKNKDLDLRNKDMYLMDSTYYGQNKDKISNLNMSKKLFSLQRYDKKFDGSLESVFNTLYIENALIIKSSSKKNIIGGNDLTLALENHIEISKKGNDDLVKEDIRSILYKYPSSYDRGYEVPLIRLIKIISYGFIGLITLIAILNVYNSTYNNISTRKREIALLKAVGIENRKLRKIILLENLISVFAAAIISLAIPIFASYRMWQAQETLLVNDLNYFKPIIFYVAGIFISFLIVYFSTVIPFSKLKEESVIQELKDE